MGSDQTLDAPGPRDGAHLYRFETRPTLYEEITLEQRGVDVAITLSGVPLEKEVTVDGSSGSLGRERFGFIAARAGTVYLKISAQGFHKDASYRVQRHTRVATALDTKRMEAFALMIPGAKKDETHRNLERAVTLWKDLNDPEQQAHALWKLAWLAHGNQDRENKIHYYLRSLPLLEQIGADDLRGMAYHNLGATFYRMGRLETAADHYQKALALRSKLDENRAATLIQMARVYTHVGAFERAFALLEEALSISRQSGDAVRLAQIHGELGWLSHQAGELNAARGHYDRALKYLPGDPAKNTVLLNFKARTLCALGAYEEARKLFETALLHLPEKDAGNHRPILKTNLAEVLLLMGKEAEAEQMLEEALVFFKGGRQAEHAHALYLLARINHRRQEQDAAFERMKRVIDLSRKISPRERVFRQGYQHNHFLYADFFLDLMVTRETEGAYPEAFQFVEDNRARQLARDLAVKIEAPQEMEQELRRLGEEIALLSLQLIKGASDPSTARKKHDLMTRYQATMSSLLVDDQNQEASMSPVSIRSGLTGDQTAVLYLALGAEQVYLWVIDAQEITFHRLGERSPIESDVRDFYEALKDRDITRSHQRIHQLGARLSRTLLGSAWKRLVGKRWLVIPDGVLHLVPFSALPVPDHPNTFLAEHHSITVLPSATVAHLLRSRESGKGEGLGIIASPKYGGSLLALPYAEAEARAILRHAADWEPTLWQGDQANKQLLLSNVLAGKRWLHLAIHGLFFPKRPELSALVLSTRDSQGNPIDGFLYAHEIASLRLSCELVVLSACESGLGRELRGEGMVGFASSFLKAGSDGVLVSLWPIHDQGTSVFMDHFYAALSHRNFAGPDALRHAQQAMINDPDWSAPYYWAGFIYQGKMEPR